MAPASLTRVRVSVLPLSSCALPPRDRSTSKRSSAVGRVGQSLRQRHVDAVRRLDEEIGARAARAEARLDRRDVRRAAVEACRRRARARGRRRGGSACGRGTRSSAARDRRQRLARQLRGRQRQRELGLRRNADVAADAELQRELEVDRLGGVLRHDLDRERSPSACSRWSRRRLRHARRRRIAHLDGSPRWSSPPSRRPAARRRRPACANRSSSPRPA